MGPVRIPSKNLHPAWMNLGWGEFLWSSSKKPSRSGVFCVQSESQWWRRFLTSHQISLCFQTHGKKRSNWHATCIQENFPEFVADIVLGHAWAGVEWFRACYPQGRTLCRSKTYSRMPSLRTVNVNFSVSRYWKLNWLLFSIQLHAQSFFFHVLQIRPRGWGSDGVEIL